MWHYHSYVVGDSPVLFRKESHVLYMCPASFQSRIVIELRRIWSQHVFLNAFTEMMRQLWRVKTSPLLPEHFLQSNFRRHQRKDVPCPLGLAAVSC